MRRALALLLVLVLGTCLGAVYAVRELAEPADKVVFTETTLYGSIGAAEGLKATKHSVLSGDIVWDSTLNFFNAGFTTHTDCRFSHNAWGELDDYEYQGVFLYDDLNSSYQTNGSDISFLSLGLNKAQAELIEETPDWQEGSKTVYLADYYDYYPINVNVELPNIMYGFPEALVEDKNQSPEIYAVQTIHDFFKIPVLPTQRYTLGVEKGPDGAVISSWGETVEEGDSFFAVSQSAVSDEACYFYFSNRTSKGNLVDTSLIPGGYGIYLLPYGEIRQDDYRGYDHYEGYDVFADQLRVFYPIDPQTKILDLSLSENQKSLLLHTAEEGKYLMTVISTETGKAVQRFELGEYGDEVLTEVISADGAVIVRIGNSFTILRPRTETQWELVYQTTPAAIEEEPSYGPLNTWYGRDFAFDGERLAVISTLYEDGWTGCGFSLAVYDREGLQYYGSYASSLDQANLTGDYENPYDNPVVFQRISDLHNPNGVAWSGD